MPGASAATERRPDPRSAAAPPLRTHRLVPALRAIAAGGVIAYPTEGVFGLGCDPFHRPALERLIGVKRRARGKGLILVASAVEQIEALCELPGGRLGRLVRASWPGPVTWILRARARLPRLITGGRRTVAVRVTAHPVAAALCAGAGRALVSTSANPSGRPPARDARTVRLVLGRRLDAVVHAPVGGLRGPTEIRDGATGAVIRPAAKGA